jgi:hypothetical protein
VEKEQTHEANGKPQKLSAGCWGVTLIRQRKRPFKGMKRERRSAEPPIAEW